MKTFGHFDDQHREYVITDPATPFPWINYLGNEDFFGLISNTATSRTVRQYGILVGNPAKLPWTAMSAVMA